MNAHSFPVPRGTTILMQLPHRRGERYVIRAEGGDIHVRDLDSNGTMFIPANTSEVIPFEAVVIVGTEMGTVAWAWTETVAEYARATGVR